MTQQGLVPDTPIMAKQTYASAMSYAGSARRIWAWTRRWGGRNIWMGLLAYSVLAVAIPLAWAVVTIWYVPTVVIFGWFLIPFRLFRRSGRKQEHLQRQQLATMQAMLVQQQAVIAENAKKAADAPESGAAGDAT